MDKSLRLEIIREAIKRGLSTLGESGEKSLWLYLNLRGFTIDNVPENIVGFVKELRYFLGLGYNFLDNIFRYSLSKALGKDLTTHSDFAQCVNCLLNEPSLGDENANK